ncbi:hypothetical protein JOF53_002261 [Crossiella equi]|uniref:Uncharacterized protein n=1 Tax=Crossiella equi TaxID=130796 RepID=A0ABS5A9X1_9PSEU|nr:hypothetical protein [Crossiella equi]MBP2473389.1 hypothetical protein [Crossiella equi]
MDPRHYRTFAARDARGPRVNQLLLAPDHRHLLLRLGCTLQFEYRLTGADARALAAALRAGGEWASGGLVLRDGHLVGRVPGDEWPLALTAAEAEALAGALDGLGGHQPG